MIGMPDFYYFKIAVNKSIIIKYVVYSVSRVVPLISKSRTIS